MVTILIYGGDDSDSEPAGAFVREVTRRQFLTVLASAVGIASLASCSRATASTSMPTSDVLSSANTGGLPKTRAWHPQSGEVSPSIKARATLLLETVGAWSGSSGGASAAQKRVSAVGFNPALIDALAPLLGAGSSAVLQVRDAQYGGILSTRASVLVVVDQWRLMPDGSIRAGGTTVDVRLAEASPHWRVVEVLPARPGTPISRLTSSAERVLSESRIHLPYAAKTDVLAGGVHDSVLRLLIAMSALHVVDVSVLQSGHPLNVFGTSRPSDHPLGRAVDVWALDSKPLVLPANHVLATSAMHLASAHGAYNVGGPVLLSGSQYFSDLTHKDHIHLGFNH